MQRKRIALWFGTAAAAACLSVGAGEKAPPIRGPIGLQLYSLRDYFKTDVPGTLAKVREMGFRFVELAGTYGLSPEKFSALLKENGLRAVAGHFPYERFQNDPEGVAKEAKALGLRYVGCAWIPHRGDFDEAECREAVKTFNRAGRLLAAQGLRFYYHNHGYEFQPYGDETLMDLLIKETSPRFVSFQMDLLWTVFPGQDPALWLKKYPRRWRLMHLKDLRKGVKGDLSGSTDTRNDVALGTGQVDLPAVLRTARKTGVRWFFIEDESPDALKQIPVSVKFLQSFKW